MILSAVHVVVILSLASLCWKREQGLLRNVFWPALALKLLSGMAIGWLYLHYYERGDTWEYLDDGQKLATLARADVFEYLTFLWESNSSSPVLATLAFHQPRALFLSKIVSVFCLLTADNYWVVSLYFSFLSFYCTWCLVRVMVRWKPSLRYVVVVAFLFVPSVVFWTSGIVKESIAMASLYFLISLFLKRWVKDRVLVGEWLLVPAALWILWNLKYYYLVVLLPVITTAMILKWLVFPWLKLSADWMKAVAWCVVFIAPLFIVTLVHPNFYPEQFLDVIVLNYNDFVWYSAPEDVAHYHALTPTVASVVKHVPEALATGFFRPFLWEAHTPFQFVIALENLVLLILFVVALPGARWLTERGDRMLTFSIVIYILILCVFLSLSSPNFGTLVRYRVGFLPFFFILIAYRNPLFERLCAYLVKPPAET